MRRITLVVIMLCAVLASAGITYAVTVFLVRTNYQGLFGVTLNVTNALSGVDRGFARANSSVTTASGNESSNPVFFPTSTCCPHTATTPIKSNDWIFAVLLSTTSKTQNNTQFTVRLVVEQSINGAVMSQNFTLYVATATVTVGAQIDCQFDVGETLGSPLSLLFTVQ